MWLAMGLYMTKCFNPRPAVRPGDAKECAEDWDAEQVSIRARP